jgi:hypothetical protein
MCLQFPQGSEISSLHSLKPTFNNSKMKTQQSTGRNIVTVAEVQRYMNKTDDSLTAFIQDCISEVSSTFENYCNKGLKINFYIDYYDGDGTNNIFVYQYPIVSISSLQYRLTPESEWQDFYIGSSTANILDEDGGKITLYMKEFPEGINNIKIEYTAGFNECPGNLKSCAKEAVVEKYQKSYVGGKPRLGQKSINEGDKNISYYDLAEEHKKILDKYKRVII